SVVVFPHPDGPSRGRNSPSWTMRERSRTTEISPNVFPTPRRTSSATSGPRTAKGHAADEVDPKQEHRDHEGQRRGEGDLAFVVGPQNDHPPRLRSDPAAH